MYYRVISLSCLSLRVDTQDIPLSVKRLKDMARYNSIDMMRKRARVTSSVSKADAMQEKSDDIAMRLMRCSTAHPVSLANVAAVANDLVGRVSRNEDTIRQALLRLAQDQMLICMKAISSNDKAE